MLLDPGDHDHDPQPSHRCPRCEPQPHAHAVFAHRDTTGQHWLEVRCWLDDGELVRSHPTDPRHYPIAAPADVDYRIEEPSADELAWREEQAATITCGQRGVCRTPPGCARHWEERNRELVRENEVLRSNCDHLSSENASLARQVESMAMRIESLAEELAKPEDVRLREVLDALDGRAVIFDGLGERVGHLLDEMDEWIGRAGEAEREADRLRKLFDDAGEGQFNVLNLVESYQRNSMEADERLRAVRKLLEWNGCECECEHHWEDHDDDCDRCLACLIGEAVGK